MRLTTTVLTPGAAHANCLLRQAAGGAWDFTSCVCRRRAVHSSVPFPRGAPTACDPTSCAPTICAPTACVPVVCAPTMCAPTSHGLPDGHRCPKPYAPTKNTVCWMQVHVLPSTAPGAPSISVNLYHTAPEACGCISPALRQSQSDDVLSAVCLFHAGTGVWGIIPEHQGAGYFGVQ